MKYNKVIIKTLILASLFAIVLPASSYAIGSISDGANSARGAQQPSTLFGDTGIFSQITNVLLFIIGAVAVIMLIIGGLKYVISGGDATKVQSAKNTILYALVGVVVAILAYAVVNFVISSFAPSSTTSGSTSSTSSSSSSSSSSSTSYGASTQ